MPDEPPLNPVVAMRNALLMISRALEPLNNSERERVLVASTILFDLAEEVAATLRGEEI